MIYKDIVNNMLSLLLTYPQIKSAEFGEISNFFTHNKKFTFALIQPVVSELYTGSNKNLNQHSFLLFVGDQLQKGGGNALNIANSNMEIINLFLYNLQSFSTDLILLRDTIQIEHDFYSQDEECFVSFVRFTLTTTSSTEPAC